MDDIASPKQLNHALCEAAGTGDPTLVESLLARGADARGHWDPDEARRDHDALMSGVAALDPPTFPEGLDLPEAMLEGWKAMRATLDERSVSAPYAHEIPLFCAARAGSVDAARTLLDAGADVGRRDNSERTALYEADASDVIRLLVERGLSLEDTDQYGWTPLDCAVTDGDRDRVEALLAAGADVNATHDRGYTVFMSAASSMDRDPAILELLVEAGADPHAVTELGYNAFHAAVDVNGEANEESSVRATLECLRRLGVGIDHRNGADQTPLARAIGEGTGVEVRVLCELGADADAVCARQVCDEDACRAVPSPLVFAAISAAVDAGEKLAALLAAGADLDVIDEAGRGPLAYARAYLDELERPEPDAFTERWIGDVQQCVKLLENAR